MLPLWFYTCAQASPGCGSGLTPRRRAQPCWGGGGTLCCPAQLRLCALLQAEALHFSFSALDLRCATWFFLVRRGGERRRQGDMLAPV